MSNPIRTEGGNSSLETEWREPWTAADWLAEHHTRLLRAIGTGLFNDTPDLRTTWTIAGETKYELTSAKSPPNEPMNQFASDHLGEVADQMGKPGFTPVP